MPDHPVASERLVRRRQLSQPRRVEHLLRVGDLDIDIDDALAILADLESKEEIAAFIGAESAGRNRKTVLEAANEALAKA